MYKLILRASFSDGEGYAEQPVADFELTTRTEEQRDLALSALIALYAPAAKTAEVRDTNGAVLYYRGEE